MKNEQKQFKTLRGWMRGKEPTEPLYFAYSATLRNHGQGLPFENISQRLGVAPTHSHRKGERRGTRSPPYSDDAWHYQPAIPETKTLEEHIDALWKLVKPQVRYLRGLKRHCRVDVFCGYRSNCDHAGVEVPHTSLALFTALEIPFGVSIIVA